MGGIIRDGKGTHLNRRQPNYHEQFAGKRTKSKTPISNSWTSPSGKHKVNHESDKKTNRSPKKDTHRRNRAGSNKYNRGRRSSSKRSGRTDTLRRSSGESTGPKSRATSDNDTGVNRVGNKRDKGRFPKRSGYLHRTGKNHK